MEQKKRVLLSPLDWGLGHTTRCVAIIHYLLALNFEVFVACNEVQKALLFPVFPQITYLPLKGYEIKYSKQKIWLPFKLIAQIPSILLSIYTEKRWLQKTIDHYAIDLTISDNRFGFYGKQVPSVFITHQLQIAAPYKLIEWALKKVNYFFIEKFNAIWVPDEEDAKHCVAGKLSHPKKRPKNSVFYIGLLNRFSLIQSATKHENIDLLISLSGPEPQRTILEQKICNELMFIKDKNIVLLRGLPIQNESLPYSLPKNILLYNHAEREVFLDYLMRSKVVLSRSGYTTIMELLGCQKKCIFIPTPGQTEQEYLAQKLQEDGVCIAIHQEHFVLKTALERASELSRVTSNYQVFNKQILENALQHIQVKK